MDQIRQKNEHASANRDEPATPPTLNATYPQRHLPSTATYPQQPPTLNSHLPSTAGKTPVIPRPPCFLKCGRCTVVWRGRRDKGRWRYYVGGEASHPLPIASVARSHAFPATSLAPTTSGVRRCASAAEIPGASASRPGYADKARVTSGGSGTASDSASGKAWRTVKKWTSCGVWAAAWELSGCFLRNRSEIHYSSYPCREDTRLATSAINHIFKFHCAIIVPRDGRCAGPYGT